MTPVQNQSLDHGNSHVPLSFKVQHERSDLYKNVSKLLKGDSLQENYLVLQENVLKEYE